MEMKSEVGVCSEDEVGGGVGEGKGDRITRARMDRNGSGGMRQSRCDRVDGMEVSDSDWSRMYVSEDGVKQVGVYSEAVVGSLRKQVRPGQWVGLDATGAIVS